MINQNEQKKDASSFFSKNLFEDKSEDSKEFKLNLLEEVLDHYNNIYYSNGMETDSKKFTFKKWQLLGASALSLVIVALIALFTFSFNESELIDTNSSLGAELAFTDGDFEMETSEDVWTDVTEGSKLEEGSSLRLAGEGRAIINLDDGSSVRLASDSAVTLTSLDPKDVVISNDQGEIYTRVVKADREFSVIVDETTFESLGTAYKTVNKKDLVGVYVYHSKVAVKNTEDKIVNEGEKLFVKTNKKDVDTNKAIELSKEDIKDEFVQWNKEQDEKEFSNELGVLAEKTETKEEDKKEEEEKKEEEKTTTTTSTTQQQPAPAPVSASISITSASSPQAGKIVVNWSISNVDTSQGFKVIYNTTGNPTYPKDNPTYIGDGGARQAYIGGLGSGTYYVRVCRYTGNGCDTYSNTVAVNVQGVQQISSVSLTYSGGKLNWTTNTGTKGQGFKIAYNTTGNPSYPANGIEYVNGFSYTPTSNGFYSICAWDGNNGCTATSNVIEVTDL